MAILSKKKKKKQQQDFIDMQVVCKLVKVKCGLYCVHNKTEEGRQTKYDRKNSTGHFLTGELKTNILCLIKKVLFILKMEQSTERST